MGVFYIGDREGEGLCGLCVSSTLCRYYIYSVCECYRGGIVVMDVIWRRLCVNMI